MGGRPIPLAARSHHRLRRPSYWSDRAGHWPMQLVPLTWSHPLALSTTSPSPRMDELFAWQASRGLIAAPSAPEKTEASGPADYKPGWRSITLPEVRR